MEIDLQRLKRSWTRDLGWLLFVIKADFGDFEPDESQLVERSADTSHALSAEGNPVTAEEWVKTQHGWSGLLLNADTIDHWMTWLARFAERWAHVEGAIVDAGRPSGPSPAVREPVPMAFVAYETADLNLVPSDDRGPVWFVEDAVTRYLAEKAMGWTYMSGGRQYFGRDNDWVEPESPDYEQALAEAIPRFLPASVGCVTKKPWRFRAAHFWAHGQVQYHQHDVSTGWQTHVDQLRSILLWTPPRTRSAWVAMDSAGNSTWSRTFSRYPHISQSDLEYNIPVLSSFVPDAHGIQLLTDEHLARAHDLSAWDITPLAGGRHLVQAADLGPWYTHAQPGLDVQATARADFGDMILTPELIEANSPWR